MVGSDDDYYYGNDYDDIFREVLLSQEGEHGEATGVGGSQGASQGRRQGGVENGNGIGNGNMMDISTE